jgi:hypothetical protein
VHCSALELQSFPLRTYSSARARNPCFVTCRPEDRAQGLDRCLKAIACCENSPDLHYRASRRLSSCLELPPGPSCLAALLRTASSLAPCASTKRCWGAARRRGPDKFRRPALGRGPRADRPVVGDSPPTVGAGAGGWAAGPLGGGRGRAGCRILMGAAECTPSPQPRCLPVPQFAPAPSSE